MLKFANIVPAILFGLAENARALGVKVPGLESLTSEVKEAAKGIAEQVTASAAQSAKETVVGAAKEVIKEGAAELVSKPATAGARSAED